MNWVINKKPNLNPDIVKLILEKGRVNPFLTPVGNPFTPKLYAQVKFSSDNFKIIQEYEAKYKEEMTKKDPITLKRYTDHLKIMDFLKQKGHSLGISATITIDDIKSEPERIKLEGYQNVRSLFNLANFAKHYQNSIASKKGSEQIAEYLGRINSAYQDVLGFVSLAKNASDLLEKIKNDRMNPTILTAGWDSHTLSIAFFGDYIILSNRGGGREKADYGTRIYKRTPETDKVLTEEYIKGLQDATADSETILKRINILLPASNLIEEMESQDQKHGTCSFVNHKSIMRPILYLMERKRLAKAKGVSEDDKDVIKEAHVFAKKAYKDYTRWMRDKEIDDIVANYKSGDIPQKVLDQLVAAYIDQHFGLGKTPKDPEKRNFEIERAFRLLQAMDEDKRVEYLTDHILKSPNSLLKEAEKHGNTKVVEFILKNLDPKKVFYNPDWKDDYAFIRKFTKTCSNFNILLQNGATPLSFALRLRWPEDIIKAMLLQGADVNLNENSGVSPIVWAIREKASKEIIEMLIDRVKDVNAKLSDGSTPFLCALEAGLPKEYIEKLIKRGADVAIRRDRDDENKVPAITVAAKVPHNIAVMELLLHHGAKVDDLDGEGCDALFLAVDDGNEENLEFLAKRIANINRVGNFGVATINVACQNGYFESVKILLKYGADINHVVSANEFTPIFDAIESKNTDLIKYLIDNHADLSHLNAAGDSVLSYAVWFGNSEIVNILLDRKADANHQTKKQMTPLMFLAMNNPANISVAEALLKHGADLNIKNDNGETALDIARDNNNDELVKFLEAAQKKLEEKPEKPKERKEEGAAAPVIFSAPKSEPPTPKSTDKLKP